MCWGGQNVKKMDKIRPKNFFLKENAFGENLYSPSLPLFWFFDAEQLFTLLRFPVASTWVDLERSDS